MTKYIQFGKVLLKRRQNMKLTQKEVDEKLGMVNCIVNYENGKRIPKPHNLNKLIEFYNLTKDELDLINIGKESEPVKKAEMSFNEIKTAKKHFNNTMEINIGNGIKLTITKSVESNKLTQLFELLRDL